MRKHIFLVILLSVSTLIKGQVIEWNLKNLYSISQSGFSSIISDARSHFKNSPNDTIIVNIDSGTYNIGGNNGPGINFNAGLNPGPKGRLIFQGAGMDQTKLIFTEVAEDMIRGANVYRLEFRDMHMTRDRYTVSQGTVVSVSPGELVLDIHSGFPHPTIEKLIRDWGQGRYFRKYTKSKTDPQVIQNNNEQVAWGWRNGALKLPEQISGDRWRFFLNNTSEVLNNYKPGDYVGIKSKKAGHIYWFVTGSDLVFRNIKWTHSSRGLVRSGFSDVKLNGCRIERGAPINGQTPCLSTSAGGPQMNQYESTGNDVSTNMIVENCFIDSTGDDCVAFFNVSGGGVKNSELRNSFARGILAVEEAQNICIENTIVQNSVISYEDAWSYFTVQEAVDANGPFTNNCDEITVNNVIKKVSAPEFVVPGEEVSISVSYEASSSRTIQVVFEVDGNPNTGYGSKRVTVPAGSSTIEVSIPIDASTPLAKGSYRFRTFITIEGSGWTDRFDVVNKIGISVVSSLSVPTISDSSWSVFPNPTNSNLYITFSDAKLAVVQLKLYTIYGQEVFKKKEENSNSNFKIDVSNLAAGNYILEIRHQKGVVKRKIVIQ